MLSKLKGLFKGSEEPGIVVPGESVIDENEWAVESDRSIIEDDICEMDSNDPIVSPALDIVTESITVFDEPDRTDPIILKGTDKFHSIVDPLVRRTDLMRLIPLITRNTLKYGNYFVEICYTDDMKIGRIKLIPNPKNIRRNESDKGVIGKGTPGSKEGSPAFEQYKHGFRVASFYPWQIHHFKFGKDTGGKYVVPHLAPSTKLWTGFRLLRNQIFSTRAEAGLMIRVHKVPVPSAADEQTVKRVLRAYKSNLTEKQVASLSAGRRISIGSRGKVPQDIYIPVRYTPDGKVINAELEVKSQVENIFHNDEMTFWLNHILSILRVPPKLIFWDVSRSRITDAGTDPEERQLIKFSKMLGASVFAGVRRIIEIELFLNGVFPGEEDFDFTIVRPSSHTTSDIVRARAAALTGQSVIMCQQAGIPVDWWLVNIVGIDPETVSGLDLAQLTPTKSEEMIFDPYDIQDLGY